MSTFQTQNSTLVSQLRQAGYQGVIFGDTSFGGNSLQGAGTAANGCIWSADFAPFATTPQSSVDFITAWKAAKSADPLSFNAEGYDAVWFVARALKNAQSLDRAKVRDAMDAITKEGMPAAVGDLTFVGHDAKVPGVLNQWLDGKPAEVTGQ
jgi:branched-chain amino acid transport system substrate-binding protein